MTRWKKFILLLSVIGPGIITANVDNDAGGITTYSMAGAHFGYSLLWSLVPITIALIVVQEMSARMGAVTGKGLAELIRENFGVKATFWLMLFLFVTDLGNTAAEFAGWAASNEIFGLSKYVSVPIGAFVVWLLIVKGSYRVVEKVFLVICVVYLVYIPAAILAKPDWADVALQTIKPSFQFNTPYVVMLIGVVGTTIAPWMQFYIQSSIVEKGIRKEQYWASRIDVIVGCFLTDIVAFFIIVACGATLFKAGVQIDTADAAVANVRAAASSLANARRALSDTEVRAPHDGRIVGLHISTGEVVAPSQSLFTLINTEEWFASANFREIDLNRIQIGECVTVYSMIDRSQPIKGIVDSIGYGVLAADKIDIPRAAPYVEPSLNWVRVAQRFPVRIRLENPPERLVRLGASAVVEVAHGSACRQR